MSLLHEESAIVEKLGNHQKHKLALNRIKEHWNEQDHFALMIQLADEIGELHLAVEEGLDPGLVWAEAADVANFAAMVAARYETHFS